MINQKCNWYLLRQFNIKHLGMGDWSIQPLNKTATRELKRINSRIDGDNGRVFFEGKTLIILNGSQWINLVDYYSNL
tara:strand:+ start:257 stop:487 length:231 start_codon:yes stop_codon:yes gene_type:complete